MTKYCCEDGGNNQFKFGIKFANYIFFAYYIRNINHIYIDEQHPRENYT